MNYKPCDYLSDSFMDWKILFATIAAGLESCCASSVLEYVVLQAPSCANSYWERLGLKERLLNQTRIKSIGLAR